VGHDVLLDAVGRKLLVVVLGELGEEEDETLAQQVLELLVQAVRNQDVQHKVGHLVLVVHGLVVLDYESFDLRLQHSQANHLLVGLDLGRVADQQQRVHHVEAQALIQVGFGNLPLCIVCTIS